MSDPAAGDAPAHLLAPDDEGFCVWTFREPGRFMEAFRNMRCRREGEIVRVRVDVDVGESNSLDGVHGGFILAFVDQAMFCGPAFVGRLNFGGAVTVAASTQFVAGGRLGEPLDALIEIVGETGRMLFVRGLMVQGERRIASFEGTLRKLAAPRAP